MAQPEFKPIGFLRTCFPEKFGTPRQAGMIPSARGVLKLNQDPRFCDALRRLEDFSHVWLIFHFHDLADPEWKPLITPPRIDAPGRIGVFASRSPHRPNSLGLSAFKLEKIDLDAPGGIEIHLSGVDVLDQTPVYDLKPYVPYVDAIENACGGWTETKIPQFKVSFSPESEVALDSLQSKRGDGLEIKKLISETLSFDPRPTSQRSALPLTEAKNQGLKFAFRILNLDVHWEIRDAGLWVNEIRSE